MVSSPSLAIFLLGSGKYLQQILQSLPSLYSRVIPIQVSYQSKHPLISSDNFCRISPGNEITEISDFLSTRNYKPVAVYNRSDTYIQLHGQIVDHFQLPGPSEKAVSFFRQKHAMHRLMVEIELQDFRPKTEIRHFSRVSEKFLEKLQYPIVVKPMIGAKSRGVFLLHSPKDFVNVNEALHTHFSQEKAIQISHSKDIVLFEEFVQGKQVTLTAYVDAKGKLHSISSVDVTTAHDLGLSHMQLIYRTTPSKYPEYIRQKMEFVLQKLIVATGLRSTFLHPEFIVTKNRVILIELNCRIAGFRYEMTKYAFQLDINKMAIQLAMGDEVDDQMIKVKSCTACEIWEEISGEISVFSIPKSKYIIDSSKRLQSGDAYRRPPQGNTPLGRFFVVSESDDSLKIAKKLRKQVRVKIDQNVKSRR